MTCFEWKHLLLSQLPPVPSPAKPPTHPHDAGGGEPRRRSPTAHTQALRTSWLVSHPQALEALNHLKGCRQCQLFQERIELLLLTFRQLPVKTMPERLKKPDSFWTFFRLEATQIGLSQWSRLPWYLRTLLQTSGILLSVAVLIPLSHKLGQWLEKPESTPTSGPHAALDPATAATHPPPAAGDGWLRALSQSSSLQKSLPPGATLPALAGAWQAFDSTEDPGDDPGENEESESHSLLPLAPHSRARPSNPVRAGHAQLWRFTIKTVAPDELQPQITRLMIKLGLPASTPGLAGTQVPGGVEFDFIAPQSKVAEIKQALEDITPRPESSRQAPVDLKNFTWYKVKAKKPIPDQTSQVVIWLSQPH